MGPTNSKPAGLPDEATRVTALLRAASDAADTASMHLDDVWSDHLDPATAIREGGSVGFDDAARLLAMAHIVRRDAEWAVRTADKVIDGLVDVYYVAAQAYVFPTVAETEVAS